MRSKWKAANHCIGPVPPPRSAASCGGFKPLGVAISAVMEGLQKSRQKRKSETANWEEECSPSLSECSGRRSEQSEFQFSMAPSKKGDSASSDW